jgi:hypothetical protein
MAARQPERIESNMKRRLLPTLLLFTLSLAFQVRPRFMMDCPEVSDAKLGLRIPVALVLQTVTVDGTGAHVLTTDLQLRSALAVDPA